MTTARRRAQVAAAVVRWMKRNPKKVKRYKKIGYRRHRVKRLANQAVWYASNRAAVRRRRNEFRIKNPAWALFHSAKRRAKIHRVPFNIEINDILIPKKCPALGVKLKPGAGRILDSSPSLDRLIPENGYVRGNIIVISHKANRIKNNATFSELSLLIKFLKPLLM